MENKEVIYQNATGPVRFKLTNDYLFKALMQENQNVLKHIICSLLYTTPDNVTDISIDNPIILGERIDNKDVILDINVSFNNGERINLEMQVVNEYNWPDRSTYYACRNYTVLNKGEDYDAAKPVYQVGILDFTPHPDHPKLFSVYKLLEVNDYYPYTEKFTICTLDLTNIHLADATDREYNIDRWASFFKANTWEDIKMLAEQYSVINDAATTIFKLSEDERIRQQCEAREDYEIRQRSLNRRIRQREEKIEQQDRIIEENEKIIEEKDRTIEEKEKTIEEKDRTIEEQADALSQKDKRIAELEAILAKQSL